MKKFVFKKYQKDHLKEIFNALRMVFETGTYADKAIEKIMRANKKWGVKDRSFVAETIYGIIRNWRFILAGSDTELPLTDKKLYTILGTYILINGEEIPELSALKEINFDKIHSKLEKLSKVRKIRESYPDWLDQLCEKELGKRWDRVSRALNEQPSMVLRANFLKTNTLALKKRMEEEHVETRTIPWAPEALELKFSRNVFRTDAFKEGLFEVQDAASQMVSDFLDVKPGMRVVDGCAGAGGKTLHLAAIMKNKGRIIALDNKPFKLQELKKRSSRAGAALIEIRPIESAKTVKRLKDSSDRLLLDVPCSGLGVLRRNPDSKWKLQPEEIERVKGIQQDILTRFCDIVKPGGKMVYATCSILPSEGEEQISWFLKQKKESWKLLGEKRYWPDTDHCDGFYMAQLERVI